MNAKHLLTISLSRFTPPPLSSSLIYSRTPRINCLSASPIKPNSLQFYLPSLPQRKNAPPPTLSSLVLLVSLPPSISTSATSLSPSTPLPRPPSDSYFPALNRRKPQAHSRPATPHPNTGSTDPTIPGAPTVPRASIANVRTHPQTQKPTTTPAPAATPPSIP